MLIRKISERLNSSARPKQAYSVLLIALFMVLVYGLAILLVTLELLQLFGQKSQLFSLLAQVTHLDIHARCGLDLLGERFAYLLATDYWRVLQLDPSSETDRLDRARQATAATQALQSVFGSQVEILTQFSAQLQQEKRELTGTLASFLRETDASQASDRVREVFQRDWLRMSVSQDFSDSGLKARAWPVPFWLHFANRLDDHRQTLAADLGILRDALDRLLAFHRRSLSTLLEEANSWVARKHLARVYASLGVFGLFYLGYNALIAAVTRRTNRWYFGLASQYQNLRADEVELQRQVLDSKASFLRTRRLDENAMVSRYLRFYSAGLQEREQLAHKPPTREQKQQQTSLTKTAGRFRSFAFDFNTASAWVVVFFGGLTFLLALVFGTVILVELKQHSRAADMIDFYAETYRCFQAASDYYLYHSVYMIYGNFIKIDGEFASDKLAAAEERQLFESQIGYLIDQRQNFKLFFGEQVAASIQTAMHSSVCGFIPESSEGFELDRRLCQANLAASKGFISFMNYEKDVLHEIRKACLAERDFGEQSKTDLSLFPFAELVFKPEQVRFRRVRRAAYSAITSLIITEGEKRIRDTLAWTTGLLWSTNLIASTVCLLLYLLVMSLSVSFVLRRDLSISSETFRQILPEILLHNKLVFKAFNEVYSVRL